MCPLVSHLNAVIPDNVSSGVASLNAVIPDQPVCKSSDDCPKFVSPRTGQQGGESSRNPLHQLHRLSDSKVTLARGHGNPLICLRDEPFTGTVSDN